MKRILILGGNRYNVPSIVAARAAGFFTLAADRNGAAPGLAAADVGLAVDLLDCDGLMAAIRQQGGVDGIVSMAGQGIRAAACLSPLLGLPSISEQAASNACSKAAMRRLWAAMGRYSTDFAVVGSEDQARRAVNELGFPLIFKPDRSFGGSRGVSRVDRPEQVPEAFAFAHSGGLSGSEVVIERCVEGSEHSCEVLIWEGKTSVLCIGQKVKSPQPYRVDLSVQYPAELTSSQENMVGDMCQRAVTALGLTQGVAHIEFCWTSSGPVLFELNARCGGGHTPQIAKHVSGVDEFIECCRMACGDPPAAFAPQARRGADYRFVIFPPGKLKQVDISPSVAEHPNVLDVGVTLQAGETVNPLRSTADRAGFVVTLAETRDAALRVADWACRQISATYGDGATAHAWLLEEFLETAP